MSALTRYEEALATIPAPGTGCHPRLLTVANLGILSGIDPAQIVADIEGAIPAGTRRLHRSEVEQAVYRATQDVRPGDQREWRPATPKAKQPTFNAEKFWAKVCARNTEDALAELWESSPVRLLDGEPERDTTLLLERLYTPDDHLFIGDRTDPGIPGTTIRTRDEWLTYFRAGGTSKQFMIPNVLSGELGETKAGTRSYRADSCIQGYRFITVEFDNIPIEQQAAFIGRSNLRVAAVIHSGHKSLHAWIKVQCPDGATWDRDVRGLFERFFKPLGADGSCANPARLSRLAGHLRAPGHPQSLIYLDPEARPLCL